MPGPRRKKPVPLPLHGTDKPPEAVKTGPAPGKKPLPKKQGGGFINHPDSKKTGEQALSPNHQRVVNWYFHPSVNFNKRVALLNAGYSESTASTCPQSVFDREDIKAAIQARLDQEKARFTIDREWIKKHYVMLATAMPAAIIAKLAANNYDLSALDPIEQYQLSEIKERTYMEGRGEDAQPVKELTLKVESRKAALEGLAKLEGLNIEKPADGTVNIIDVLNSGRARMKRPGGIT
jgi:hypothetical protein